MATIVNGKEIAKVILDELSAQVGKLGFVPLFCDVLVGDDSVARSYVNTKAKAAEAIGLKFQMLEVPADITNEDLIAKIRKIQEDKALSGLIIQLPVPPHLDKNMILSAIDPWVDVDCLNPSNSELFYKGRSQFLPPTAAAIMTVLMSLKIDLSKLNILVIGQGELVGRPVTFLLKELGHQVYTADESTQDLKNLARAADVIISGTGQPKLITADLIKEGAVVIDCGTAESSGSIVGDVDLDSVKAKASFVSPVPGGVGPVTVARLLYNVVLAAKDKG